MSYTQKIKESLSDKVIYKAILSQIGSIISADEPIISNLSNITAVLKQNFDKISWVGFYILEKDKLFLGPFQGKLACTIITAGKGVCGTAVSQEKTIIVNDVNEFEGHIACDPDSKSEIVVPILNKKSIFGVLDVDSSELSSFNEFDKLYLEELCGLISKKLPLEKFKLS